MVLIFRREMVDVMKARFDINPPATPEAIAFAEVALGISFTPYFQDLFLTFDGFASADTGSLVKIWCLEDIVRNRGRMCLESGIKYHVAGDAVISSHHILFAFENEELPVYYTDIDEEYSSNVDVFLDELARGKLDI